MSNRAWLSLILLLAVASTQLGCPSCPYDSTCEGTTLRTCTLGVDQMVGSPSWGSFECRAPNGVCVTLDERSALCAMDPAPSCDASFAPTCSDDAVVTCVDGYRVAEDCRGDGNVCLERPDGPTCAREPITECEAETYASHCDGTSVVSCAGGLEHARDCARYDPPGLCRESENEYGRSAWCDLP